MSADLARHRQLEWLLARVLDRGTWLASCVIALGLALTLIAPSVITVAEIINGGIALFILLPVLRVLLMLIAFVRAGDYRFGVIAALVLTIIALGVALGVYWAGSLPG